MDRLKLLNKAIKQRYKANAVIDSIKKGLSKDLCLAVDQHKDVKLPYKGKTYKYADKRTIVHEDTITLEILVIRTDKLGVADTKKVKEVVEDFKTDHVGLACKNKIPLWFIMCYDFTLHEIIKEDERGLELDYTLIDIKIK